MKITIFTCEWLPYTSAEIVWKQQKRFTEENIIVKINCTGQINSADILKTFSNNSDGVIILGCDEKECHYINGSQNCHKIIDQTAEILDKLGIERQRLQFETFSNIDSDRFLNLVNNFAQKIKALSINFN